jgi:hypothetical protein
MVLLLQAKHCAKGKQRYFYFVISGAKFWFLQLKVDIGAGSIVLVNLYYLRHLQGP